MDVAIRGDRASCLTMQLASHSWLFAVARGFGTVDGTPVAALTLARLRAQCESRLRHERFRRAIDRSSTAATAFLGALARVNAELHTRSAAHDDYVTAACSLSAVLVVRGRAYVVHAGGTAVYLAHRGDVRPLCSEEIFDDSARPLLTRALGIGSTLDVSVSSVSVAPGDVMVLLGHRVRGEIDRRALIAHVEEAGPSEHLLVVRFDPDDYAVDEAEPDPVETPTVSIVRVGIALLALISFLITVVGWTH